METSALDSRTGSAWPFRLHGRGKTVGQKKERQRLQSGRPAESAGVWPGRRSRSVRAGSRGSRHQKALVWYWQAPQGDLLSHLW